MKTKSIYLEYTSLRYIYQVYTWYIFGISFPSLSQSVLQLELEQNRAWGAHAHRFWIARWLMFITATRNPSARAAAAIATAPTRTRGQKPAGSTGLLPILTSSSSGPASSALPARAAASFAGRRRRRPGRRCRRWRRRWRWGGSTPRAGIAGAGGDSDAA